METKIPDSPFAIATKVTSYETSSVARFLLGDKLLCEAWCSIPEFRKISVPQAWFNIEDARAVATAIGMAVEWLETQE